MTWVEIGKKLVNGFMENKISQNNEKIIYLYCSKIRCPIIPRCMRQKLGVYHVDVRNHDHDQDGGTNKLMNVGIDKN